MMRSVVWKVFFCVAALTPVGQAWAQLDRSKPPAPAPQRKTEIAAYKSFDLPNGLRVLLVEDRSVPKVWFSVQLLHDPFVEGDKAGCADIAAGVMRQGTKKRPVDKLEQELSYIGASLSASSTSVYIGGLTRYVGKLLDLMTDVLYNPAFREDDFERLLQQARARLRADSQNPETISTQTLFRLIYGKNHPYGNFLTQKTLEHIGLPDCKKYYSTYFRPNNAYLVVVGDMTLEQLKPLAARWFGRWRRGEIPHHDYPTPVAPAGIQVVLTNFPYAVQSIVRIAYPIDLKIGNPYEAQIDVLSEVLGGSSSGRLFRSLREEKGYTYGAYFHTASSKFGGRAAASFSTRNETTGVAISEALAQMRRMRTEPISAQELSGAKAVLIGDFVGSLENPFTVANFAFNIAQFGLPSDYYSSYPERLQQVSVDDVLSAAKRYILPDNAYVQLSGKYRDVVDQLKELGPVSCYDVMLDPVPCPEGGAPE